MLWSGVHWLAAGNVDRRNKQLSRLDGGTLTGWDNKLLLCGNPNRLEGVFYDSHHSDRDKYRTHKVSSLDSARTSRDSIYMLLRKYGQDSDVKGNERTGSFYRNAESIEH